MTQTTFDLSTLSDIADGAHTVKVKAKADGYRDSEFSNEVNYTKAPAVYSGTIANNVQSDYAFRIYDINGNYLAGVPVNTEQNVTGNYFKSEGTRNDVTLKVNSIRGATHTAINSYTEEINVTDNNFYVVAKCTKNA